MRNGLQRFLTIAHTLCVLFGRWRGSIIAAVDASDASPEHRQQLKNLIASVDTACAAIDGLRMRFER